MYTEREIKETPNVLKRLLNYDLSPSLLELIRKSSSAIFVGCGSSYHLSFTLSQLWRVFLKKPSYAFISSEIVTNMDVWNVGIERKNSLVIVFSRSGETTEAVYALKKFKNSGFKTVGVSCKENSELLKESDVPLFVPVKEHSVVMTSSFTGILFLFERIFYNVVGKDEKDLVEFSDFSINVLNESLEIFKEEKLENYEHFVFFGMAENWGISNESSLKMKEMALVFSESHSTLDYRHGPKALVSPRTMVILQTREDENNESIRRELEGLGAKVYEVGSGKDISIPSGHMRSDTFLRVIPAQVLALEVAKRKGINPDRPRNLERVVKINIGQF